MTYEEYFLDYKNESTKEIHNYEKILEKAIEQKINYESPYISGDFEHKLVNYLENLSLDDKESNPENVLQEMSTYFSGTTRWHHPYVMNNIKTPVNLVSAAVANRAILYDPNLAGDTNCGKIAFAELEVVKYLSDVIGWDWKKSGGYFTFGGTSTLLNAVKIGLNKAIENSVNHGIVNEAFIVSSEQGHSAHADVCNWLGIGRNNCYRMPVDRNYQIDVSKTEQFISQKIEEGKKWAGIIACGGTTIQTLVDPIYEIYRMRDRIVKKYDLSYKPHIHVDSVVGWVWLFYKRYDFKSNPLSLVDNVLSKIEKMMKMIAEVIYADSIGIDFHKTGFCPYASSLILTKDGAEISELNGKGKVYVENIEYGNYSPSTYTLELSRSSTGPLTALTALKLFGYEGYQRLLGDILSGVNSIMNYISLEKEFELINQDTNGTCMLFVIKPPKICVNYNNLSEENEKFVKSFALYNYHFYLFVLQKIRLEEINFFIDYSSGYEKVKNGFHMGVLKMQTFNPMISDEIAHQLVEKIKELKQEYDSREFDANGEYCYKPKGFKLRYKDKQYKNDGGKVCLKK